MTDVVVQNLATKGSTTIKCGAPVTKVAVSERRLAVQLQDCLLVYGLPEGAVSTTTQHPFLRAESVLHDSAG